MKSDVDRNRLFADAEAPEGAVVHLVGRVTDAVFGFLGPTTAALAQQGVPQTVVLLDDPRYRHLLPQFHEAVRLVLVDVHGPIAERAQGLLGAFRAAVQARPAAAAHLHGLAPLILAMFAARHRGMSLPTYFSPHGSRLLGPLRVLAKPVLALLKPFAIRSHQRTIVSSRADERSLHRLGHGAVEVVESPVAEIFFDTPLVPDQEPLVIACGREPNPFGAALYAQCAVLLADQMPGLRFAWLGRGDAESTARLKAAGVTRIDVVGDAARARAMATGWIFLAPPGRRGAPVFLSEAMALGLPCVAWDTPQARDLITDGVSGLLCTSTERALERVAELMESNELRARLGAQARRDARVRFDGSGFRESMLGVYGSSTVS